jgi:hypothetical protein
MRQALAGIAALLLAAAASLYARAPEQEASPESVQPRPDAYGSIPKDAAAMAMRPGHALAADRRARVETALRKALAFYEQQQHGGGWASAYALDLDSRWGEWLPVEKNVITVNHDATTGIGLIFLRASELLKEPSYRQISQQAGELLVSGQPKHGGFPEELRLTSEGSAIKACWKTMRQTGRSNCCCNCSMQPGKRNTKPQPGKRSISW